VANTPAPNLPFPASFFLSYASSESKSVPTKTKTQITKKTLTVNPATNPLDLKIKSFGRTKDGSPVVISSSHDEILSLLKLHPKIL